MPLADRGRARRQRGRDWILVAAVVLLWPILLAAAAGGGRLLPGTRLGGRSLAFLGPAAAAERIRGLEGEPIAVTGLDTAAPVLVDRTAMGLLVDEAAALETARTWSGSRGGRRAALLAGAGAPDLPLPYRLDETVAAAWLAGLKTQVDREATAAFVDLENGEPRLQAAREGLQLDLAGSLERLRAAQPYPPERYEPLLLRLPAPEVDGAAALQMVGERLAAPLAMEAYDPISDEVLRWELPAAAWLPAARRVEWDGRAWRWRLRPEGSAALRADLASRLGERRVVDEELLEVLGRRLEGEASAAVRLFHPARSVAVREGDTVASIGRQAGIPFPWILAANPGLGDALRPGQTITLPSPDDLLPLPPRRDRRIVVRLGAQRMQAFQDGALRWDWAVSTGIPSSPTATGVFQVQDRQERAFATAWDLWMPQFLAIYQPDPRVQVYNGFHGLPWHKDGRPVWSELIGQPASYGCIVLATEHARLLYDWALPGTLVEVRD